jgi:hypothetical protein
MPPPPTVVPPKRLHSRLLKISDCVVGCTSTIMLYFYRLMNCPTWSAVSAVLGRWLFSTMRLWRRRWIFWLAILLVFLPSNPADQGRDHEIMALYSNRTSSTELRAQYMYEDSPYSIDVVMWLSLEVILMCASEFLSPSLNFCVPCNP